MFKNVCKLSLAVMLVSIPFVYADNAGALHFSTIGGSSMVGQMGVDTLNSNMINDAAYRFSQEEKSSKNNNENINTRYNFKKSNFDASDNSEEVPCGGTINASKTMYTDDLGRLHFFSKGSIKSSSVQSAEQK